jgi:8-oxo-dGTP diphosphatase
MSSRVNSLFQSTKVQLCLLAWFILSPFLGMYFMSKTNSLVNCPYVWHGGSPSQSHRGSCWCGADSYCMCTPSLAIDAIIELPSIERGQKGPQIVLIQRSDREEPTYAIPGGFVDVGETVEAATEREVKEETNLHLQSLEQFRVYSDPKRDARRHTVSAVFRCVVNDFTDIRRGDDAKSVVIVPLQEALKLNLAFDHRKILSDYILHYHPSL